MSFRLCFLDCQTLQIFFWFFRIKLHAIKATVDKVNREDIWKAAATALGVPAAQIPATTSRGIETFFDGVKFDPEKPEEYLKGLAIKKA